MCQYSLDIVILCTIFCCLIWISTLTFYSLQKRNFLLRIRLGLKNKFSKLNEFCDNLILPEKLPRSFPLSLPNSSFTLQISLHKVIIGVFLRGIFFLSPIGFAIGKNGRRQKCTKLFDTDSLIKYFDVKLKSTTPGLPKWSPTLVLPRPDDV